MNLSQLHERLRLEMWRRIERGALTSTLLARQTGLRPSHISNFLHRKRRLSLPALDRLLSAQMLSIEDVLGVDTPTSRRNEPEPGAFTAIPIVAHAVAMNSASILQRSVLEVLSLPRSELERFPPRRALTRRTWHRFVAVRVTGDQAFPMLPLLRELSVAVIDRHYNSLVPYDPPRANLYALRVGNALLFRHLLFESNRFILRPHVFEYPIEVLELAPYESPSDLIIGRVCLCLTEP